MPNMAREFWRSLTSVFLSFNFPMDLVDIAVVAFIIYQGIRVVRETRAMQLVKGIGAILIIYFLARQLHMITISFFLQNMISVGIFLVVVLFQPELRSALEKMGRAQFATIRFSGSSSDEYSAKQTERLIDILADSCVYLSAHRTGALIVVERKTKLGDIIKTGTTMDSLPSKELICNIFFTNSPLHDGAMVIRDCRLFAAGCYLPLSQNMDIGRELGTRHRAALGISEVSDAMVLVVSEESGAISIALDSKLQRDLSEQNLRKLLALKLIPAENTAKPHKKIAFWRKKP